MYSYYNVTQLNKMSMLSDFLLFSVKAHNVLETMEISRKPLENNFIQIKIQISNELRYNK